MTTLIKLEIPDKLLFFIQDKARYKVAFGGRGGGKCLGIGTPIMMFDGTIKVVEDVKKGEMVMGPDSKPRKVLSTTRGISELFEVNQTSGMTYVVNDEHILSLKKSEFCCKDKGEISLAGNARRPNGRYPSWPDIVNIPIKDYLKQSDRWKAHFRGYRAGLIKFKSQEIDLDPYLLGLWLGDGLHRELMITSMDIEIIEWLRNFATENGLKFTIGSKQGTEAKNIRLGRIQSIHGNFNPVWNKFKNLNVVSNKHIPQCYISNSEEVRLKLLAGLLDTDGTLSKNKCYSITLTNERLAKDVKHLADTLGFRTSIAKRKTVCYNNGKLGVAWRIGINGDIWKIPCLIERKKLKKENFNPNKDKSLSEISVKSIGVGEYAGFELDGDHLFCLADGTVTHNSWAAALCLVLMAYQDKHKILCTRAYQNSILESVHSLLVGAINRLGLQHAFEITKTGIKTKHRGLPELESEFIFKGLQNNIDEIKSMEGVTICWVEEAHSIDGEGWKTLIPTIRYAGSEIWITFNPKYATDATYVRFVENPRPNSIVVKINYDDNPFFKNTTLVAEMEYDKEHNYDEYRQTWLGEPRSCSDALVFKDLYSVQEFEDHPIEICLKKKRFFGLDFGYNDPTVAIRSYIVDNTLYITHEAYKKQILPNDIPALLRKIPDINNFSFTIYGDSSRPDLINDLYFKNGFKNMKSVKKTTKSQDTIDKQKAKSYVISGIDFMKRFKIVIHPRCVETIKEFQNYSWKVEMDANGKEIILDELIDDWNHCIDAIRYALADLIVKGRTTMADIAHAIAAKNATLAQKLKLNG